MTGKYPWIVLLVTLHISVVLCRSTEKPKDEENVVHEGPILFPHGHSSVVKSVDLYFAPNMGEPTPERPVPSKMSNDVYSDEGSYISYRCMMAAGTIAGILVGILCIIAFITGCIFVFCCKKQIRRPGYIVSSATRGHIAGMKQTGFTASETVPKTAPVSPGTFHPMQQYPPAFVQAQ